MNFCLVLALALQAPAADPWKQLESDEAAVRKEAFEQLKANPDAAVQAKLKKAAATAGKTWVKKVLQERTRALKGVVAASRKGFNPAEFAAKQKEIVDLLATGDTKKMEAPVKALWKQFYYDPAEADRDPKVAEARARVEEAAAWQKALSVPDKDSPETAMREATLALDEAQLLAILQKRDQKVMADNAALRTKLPPGDYRQIHQTNLYRMLIGKPALRIDVKLCDAARGHSKDMREHDFFSHTSPLPGKTAPGDRATLAGTSGSGENIYRGKDDPESAFWAWFFSLGHHKNMAGDYSTIGVGSDEKFWTQMFG